MLAGLSGSLKVVASTNYVSSQAGKADDEKKED